MASGVDTLEFIDKIMDAAMYREILRKNLRPGAAKLGIAKSFASTRITIGNIGLILRANGSSSTAPKSLIRRRSLQIVTQSKTCGPITNELEERLQEEWTKIPLNYLQTLVMSMPHGLRAIVQAKGVHIKYEVHT